MAVREQDVESRLIDSVCERVRERLPSEQVDACIAFIRQYYQWVPAEDLVDRSPRDLYGAAVAHWNLAQEREPGEVKVRVYNPDFEQDGWRSPHTVIEIVSDDMPFVVDSVTMALARRGYGIDLVIHPVVRVRRDEHGRLLDVLDHDADGDDAVPESILHAEVAREPDGQLRDELRAGVEYVLEQVRAAVEDWKPMRERAGELAGELGEHPPPVDPQELEEARELLAWLAEDNFTFLGYREYELVERDGDTRLEPIAGSGLGILRGASKSSGAKPLGPKAVALAKAPHLLVLTKANSRSTVHRPAYLDYVGVKRFDSDGNVVGERRFLGLYTNAAYKASPRQIPLVRGKVDAVLRRAGFPPASHDQKALLAILESYPRESLFEMGAAELFDVAIGILGVGERQRVRLFVWRDPLDRFVECLVCIPRDRYNTENREKVGKILVDAFGGTELAWSIQLTESVLARVHYTVRCAGGVPERYDVAAIEAKLVQATRAWSDDLRAALIEELGEEGGTRLYRRYARAFPPGYRSDWVGRSAVEDISRIEELSNGEEPIISLYRPREAGEGLIRCKLFSSGGVSLSDVLPTFEHMGARVVDERPYEVSPADGSPVWIYDFGLKCVAKDVELVRESFQETFLGVWNEDYEDDRFNSLVLRASLTGREITVIRAIAKYLRQAGIAFSDAYMERTLMRHADVAALLVKLFAARFDPDDADSRGAEEISGELEEAIDGVESLDEDRILRAFLAVVRAMLRTNYYREEQRPFLSFKLDPTEVPVLPQPRPRFEIFVYSPRVEGVHLRGGRVARGGIRWSDRPEDFRTETLGLMKAQMVKNALIVPVGAKGGFVVKRPPQDREELREEAIASYRTYLSGLLDLTDNICDGDVVAPDRVVRYDEDDPYLVVAADKGTAQFSDIANEVSAEYGFWLGDAFASGGSHGYDHKQMGITARGAWESVTRHFRELGTDVQEADFTAVGIGDMSGDVFGNGMLLSRHVKLLAAFNHSHVLVDPDPDPERSYEERKRLFECQGTWTDYDESVISEGGGVYSRTDKSIPISEQAKRVLEIEDDELSGPELVRAVLKAPVDLLFNGGIGTYVKASSETHADAGDKANDAVRVDARDLRCRVVGEGGNLGFTQLGRIEYALAGGPDGEGGKISTDAIDNVGGVNCSDHEVNIKILLDALVRRGELSVERRNELLREMTGSVGDRVVYASYIQTQAISLALAQAAPMIDVHARLIRQLEQVAGLDRQLEFLPSDDAISERKAAHQGLVAPELAVLMAYCKIHLYEELLESDLPEDDYLCHDLERYFPAPLPDRYSEEMRSHRLRREITATVVANQMVDRAGTTFAFRLGEETGATASNLARGYAVARDVFEMRQFWAAVKELDNEIAAETQLEMLIEGRRLVERATRWLVRANPRRIEVAETIEQFSPGARALADALPDVLEGIDRENFDARSDELRGAGVPGELAERVASMPAMISAFDLVEVAADSERGLDAVMALYFRLGSQLELNWLRDRVIELPRTNRWQALARAALREDLYGLHHELTREVLAASGPDADEERAIEVWSERNRAALERCLGMLSDIRASRSYDMTTLPVALREVRNLLDGGFSGPASAARSAEPAP